MHAGWGQYEIEDESVRGTKRERTWRAYLQIGLLQWWMVFEEVH